MKRFLIFACAACALMFLATSCEKKSSGVVTIFGNVVDESTGNPLPVVQVTVEGNNGVATVSTVTGSDGTYEVDVTIPEKKESFFLVVSVSKKGYVDDMRSFTAKRDMIGKRVQQSFTIARF